MAGRVCADPTNARALLSKKRSAPDAPPFSSFYVHIIERCFEKLSEE